MNLMAERVKLLAMEIAEARVKILVERGKDFENPCDQKQCIDLAVQQHQNRTLIESIIVDGLYRDLFFQVELWYATIVLRKHQTKLEETIP